MSLDALKNELPDYAKDQRRSREYYKISFRP